MEFQLMVQEDLGCEVLRTTGQESRDLGLNPGSATSLLCDLEPLLYLSKLQFLHLNEGM